MRTVWTWCVATVVAVSGTQANAAWYEAQSKHFIIYADQSPKALQTSARRLEKFDQAVRRCC